MASDTERLLERVQRSDFGRLFPERALALVKKSEDDLRDLQRPRSATPNNPRSL